MHDWRQHLHNDGSLQHCACVGEGDVKPKGNARPSACRTLLLQHWGGSERGGGDLSGLLAHCRCYIDAGHNFRAS